MSALASRFSSRRTELRSDAPLSDDEIRRVAPSIFAEEKHVSRSGRYAHIPTGDVLLALRKQGFQPFMAAQTRTRDEGKREHTKHMLRLRHADQIATGEANEIILLNSHDGTSSYQMMAGVFRFVCANGMVCGEISNDIRIRHSGNVVDGVIDGAFRVLDDFERVDQHKDAMKGIGLNPGEQAGFARAALALKYDTEVAPAPVTESQILCARRASDAGSDLWTTFNRVQENVIRGGLDGRSARNKRVTTRPVKGIDQNIKLNRALWVLAEEMRKLKG